MKNEFLLKHITELSPIMEECLRSGKKVRLTVVGNSMFPLFSSKRDSVVLSKKESYRKYDIIFYRRENGACIWQHQQITQIRTTGTIHSCLRKSIEYCIFILIPSCIVPRTITTLWSYLNKPKRKTSIRNAMPKLSCTDKRINVLSITLDV